ncbi:hypothetical protein VNO80_12235 [Phaseolus coccineus]|uniref:Uncharacterized protein n=1 Tax=Phaseolus coccineus TaxID=3886 RepID=A0AAN9R692_PHACN
MLSLFLEYYSCKKVFDEKLNQKLPGVSVCLFCIPSIFHITYYTLYAELVIDTNLNICLFKEFNSCKLTIYSSFILSFNHKILFA